MANNYGTFVLSWDYLSIQHTWQHSNQLKLETDERRQKTKDNDDDDDDGKFLVATLNIAE